MPQEVTFRDFTSKVMTLLKTANVEYMIVGGIAAGVLGEPRLTEDIDIILFVEEDKIPEFLKRAETIGFKFHSDVLKQNLELKGTFRLLYKGYYLDIILPSTEFEKEAFRRREKLIWGKYEAWFPSPEDFIVLKIVPGRPKDLLDAESVYIRHKKKLDMKYLEKWAQWFSDEAEDMRIYNNLKKIVRGLKF